FKTDPEAAKQTIADTTNAIILLSVMLSPFTPGLAKKMQDHFNCYGLSDQGTQLIYQSRWKEWISVIGSRDCKLSCEPGVLVPKIEKKDLELLEQEFLKALHERK